MELLGFVGWFIIALIVIAFLSIILGCFVSANEGTEDQIISAWFISTIIAATFFATMVTTL